MSNYNQNRNGTRKRIFTVLAATIVLSGATLAAVFASCAGNPPPAQFPWTAEITILATSDVHNNYMDYDYFIDQPTEQSGLVRLAGAINAERKENKNVLLFDNGDYIQGNPFGEYIYKNPPAKDTVSPMVELLNALQYDGMTLGNHEFNFGLDYLKNILFTDAKFPIVCANVLDATTKQPYFTPYTIIKYDVVLDGGGKTTLNIGLIGLVPPQILAWDNVNLAGKVLVDDGYDTAVKYIPEMKAKGTDIIVILSHSGISGTPRVGGEENFSYYLAQIPDVDVLITGHAHERFPSNTFAKLSGADLDAGTINGIPAIMPGSFANNLGVIKVSLQKDESGWHRVAGSGKLIPLYDSTARKANYPADPELVALLKKSHEATLAFIRAPVGAGNGGEGAKLTAPLTSFFALLRDDYSVELINDAQLWETKNWVASNPEYASFPILSAAAPFKAGGRQGPNYYTNVPAGTLAIKNMADIYVYSNTLAFVKVTGAQVKEWLEMSAGQFNQINAGSGEPQELINGDFPTYNYDVITGVTYTIDVSQPARYSRDGELANASAERIKNLQHNGAAINPAQQFVVATNNYRAGGGGNFPDIGPDKIIYASPDENRQVILRYIEAKGDITPVAGNTWKLSLPAGAKVQYLSSPLAKDTLPAGVTYAGDNSEGFAIYNIDPALYN